MCTPNVPCVERQVMLRKPSERKQQRMILRKKVRQPVVSHCVPPAISATGRVHRIKEGPAGLVLARPDAGRAITPIPKCITRITHHLGISPKATNRNKQFPYPPQSFEELGAARAFKLVPPTSSAFSSSLLLHDYLPAYSSRAGRRNTTS